jgi:putative ATP-dependent endonuclease of OLD family
MAKIHSLKISNFRGIQKLEQVFGITDFICLIGRGDSGKTTILEAISAVLSPSWNLTFYDTDFFNGDIEVPIEIEVSMYDLPKDLIQENKYGLFIRGLDKSTDIIFDDVLDDHETILTLKLIV